MTNEKAIRAAIAASGYTPIQHGRSLGMSVISAIKPGQKLAAYFITPAGVDASLKHSDTAAAKFVATECGLPLITE